MKKGVIITNAYYNTEKTVMQAERMKVELERLGASVSIIKNSGTFCAVSDIFENRFDFDFAVYFDKDILVAKALENAGVRVFNSSSSIQACDDKMLTFLKLDGYGISMPTTVSGSFSYTNEEVDQNYIDSAENAIGEYPFVVKKSSSSLGAGVYLAESREELVQILNELGGEKYLVQEFVRESAGKDIRIIAVGGKAVACMKRESSVDFRSNAELGGICKPIVCGQKFIEMAEKVAKILELDYCGVDILIRKDGTPTLCEVNSNAFFHAIENVTKVNVAKIYAEHIMKEMSK